MASGYYNLPGYQSNAMANFAPVNNAMAAWGETTRQNAMAEYQAGQDKIQNQRADAQMGMQQQAAQRQQKQFEGEQEKEILRRLAGAYQHIQAAPEAERAGMYQRFQPLYERLRPRIKEYDDDLRAAGLDPADFATAGPLLTGMVAGWQDPLDREYKQAQINKLNREPAGAGRLSLQPVYGYDADGNSVVMQASPTGELVQSRVPHGVTVDPALSAQRKRAATEAGAAQGKAASNLPLAEQAAERMLEQIDALMKNPGLEQVTGSVYGRMPKWTNTSEGAKEAQSRIDQVLGGTFLQAYNDLRGGGQITEIEGKKATDAYNRLQNQELGTPAYRQALMDFRNEIVALREIARQKAGGTGQQTPAPDNPFKSKYGLE